MKVGSKEIQKQYVKDHEQPVRLCQQCFSNLLSKIQQTNWKVYLTQTVKKYSLESYKLSQLLPKNVQTIYRKISLKYKNNQSQRMVWYQNELRLFIWFLISSQGVFNTSSTNYGEQQLKQLSKLFFGIHKDLCQYQFKSVICPQLYRPWEPSQNQLLSEILKKHSPEGSWSNIAKQLFLSSGKKYFRTPQTCRERWQNHLDNRKVRGQWTLQQDFLLIKFILSEGKKWSIIARKIGDTRTEHMVKNRFQTLLRRQFKSKKRPTRFSEEFQFCKQLLNKFSQMQKLKIVNEQNVVHVQQLSFIAVQNYQNNIYFTDQEISNDEVSEYPIILIQNVRAANQHENTIQSYLSFMDLKNQDQNMEHKNDQIQNKIETSIFPESVQPLDLDQKLIVQKKYALLSPQIPSFMNQQMFQKQDSIIELIPQ